MEPEFKHRNVFQVERMILFTDAVFAIAITLLALELKIPSGGSTAELAHGLLEMIPRFMGFLVSFGLIGFYWSAHHKMFAHVKGYDAGLIFRNLVLLMFIVLMPFSTEFAFERFSMPVDVAFIFYDVNNIGVGLCFFWLWNYIARKPQIGEEMSDTFLRHSRARALGASSMFTLSLIICCFQPVYGRFALFLIGPVLSVIGIKSRRAARQA